MAIADDTEALVQLLEQSLLDLAGREDPGAGASWDESASADPTVRLRRLVNRTLGLGLTFERLRRRERELSALYATAGDLSSLRGVEDVLQAIVRRARQLLTSDVAYITLIDDERTSVRVRTADGTLTAGFRRLRLPVGSGLGGLVAQTGEALLTSNFATDPRIIHDPQLRSTVSSEGLVAILCVPLKRGDEVTGVLYAADRRERTYTSDDAALLTSLAAHAAIALENARLFEESRSALERSDHLARELQQHGRRLERMTAVDDQLLSVVLEEGSPDAFARELSGLLDAAVVLLDEDGKVIGRSHPEDDSIAEAARTTWRESTGPVSSAQIAVGSESLGLIVADRPVDDEEARAVLERAALVSAVALLQRRSVAETEHRMSGELVGDLISGTADRESLLRRASLLGVDLDGPRIAIVAYAADMQRLRRLSRNPASRLEALVGEAHSRLVLLLPGSNVDEAVEQVRLVFGWSDGHVTAAAAGPATGKDGFADVHRLADRTLSAMLALGRVGCVAAAEELGVFGLLLSGNDPDSVAGFLQATIGPLLQYDASHQTELVKTLEQYFRHAANVTQAARALPVHVNTMYQRLERIGALLGAGWQEPDRSLQLNLALRLRHLAPLI